jgi:hypothetical protein
VGIANSIAKVIVDADCERSWQTNAFAAPTSSSVWAGSPGAGLPAESRDS